ncbi:HD domain-containing protein [Bosea vestrisii]|uniref:HD domain-containing protein n=1 Tax=Bosea vestrisii TaxID=151416 RepID=UPI0024DFAA8E|nr:HD domain-containing protein [Bosea vestrisii]WID96054.1 HD domain-containing protein [Bosea vestrisii]
MREDDNLLRDQIALVTHAAGFAARVHNGQTRKGESGPPFILHLAEVADLLAKALENPDPELIAAAWLHDVVEKTKITSDEIENVFGPRVASLIAEVSDDKSLPETERHRMQIETIGEKSEAARLLRLADKISGLRELAEDPPAGWDVARRRDWLQFATDVAAGCRGLNAALDLLFDQAAAAAAKSINDLAARPTS